MIRTIIAVSNHLGTSAKQVGLTCGSANPAAQQRRPTNRYAMVVVICYILLTLFAADGRVANAAELSTNTAVADRILLIDSSSMPVTAGQATLIIGELRRTNGVYSGDYKLKVFPYFLKNDKGRLAITVSDATLAKASHGQVVSVTGTATSVKTGLSRDIEATATPTNASGGKLKLWFTAGDRKMIFEPAYHFAESGRAMVHTPTTETNVVANHL